MTTGRRRCSPWWTVSSGTHRGRRNHLCHQSCNRCSLLHVAWATRCDQSRDASTPLDRRRVLDHPRIRIIALHLDHVIIPGLNVSYVITKSSEHAPLRRFFKAAVDGLQLVFDRSLVTSVQPKSLLVQMREVVADCDDVSSDGSLMLLSPPHDIPEATLPAESSMDQETLDETSPVVSHRQIVRCSTLRPAD